MQRIDQELAGQQWSLNKAMAQLEKVSFATDWHENRVRASKRVAETLFHDRDFWELPVLVIVLAWFEDLDQIFFDNAFGCRAFIGKGKKLRRGALGMTHHLGSQIMIELSSEKFDSEKFMRQPKHRVRKILKVLIHEMCHAYRPIVVDHTQPHVYDDIDDDNFEVRDGHGVYFRWIMGFCQRTLDRLDWPVNLHKDRWPLIQSDKHAWSQNSNPVRQKRRQSSRS